MKKIKIGNWRDDAEGPMQVVSGPVGRQHVDFVAPAAKRLKHEMQTFLDWFNEANEKDWGSRESFPSPFLVRDNSSFRRWKRPPRARHRRYRSCSVGTQFAALL